MKVQGEERKMEERKRGKTVMLATVVECGNCNEWEAVIISEEQRTWMCVNCGEEGEYKIVSDTDYDEK